MMEPWSPASSCYSEVESTCGPNKPATTFLIGKLTPAGVVDFSSSDKELMKLMTEKQKGELTDVMKLANQRSNPDQNNHYGQMLKEGEALYQRDPNHEDVKDLRHFLPLFRKVVYIRREDIEKKMKLKSMWSEKPSDWPSDVVHVDPNNPGTDRYKKKMPKPKKPELVKMFNHLTRKYAEKRDELFQDFFGHSPDEEPAEGSQEEVMENENSLRSLAKQVSRMYVNPEIEKVLNALIKGFETMDSINDVNSWAGYNRQKYVLEGDLRECVFRHTKGCLPEAAAFFDELKVICKNIGVDPNDIMAAADPVVDEPESQIPLVLDEAKSPTNSSRKRKPTLRLDMEQECGQNLPNLYQNFMGEDVVFEQMELGTCVEVTSDTGNVITHNEIMTNAENGMNGEIMKCEDGMNGEIMKCENGMDGEITIMDNGMANVGDMGNSTGNMTSIGSIYIKTDPEVQFVQGQGNYLEADQAVEKDYPFQLDVVPNAQLSPINNVLGQPVDVRWNINDYKAIPVSFLQQLAGTNTMVQASTPNFVTLDPVNTMNTSSNHEIQNAVNSITNDMASVQEPWNDVPTTVNLEDIDDLIKNDVLWGCSISC